MTRQGGAITPALAEAAGAAIAHRGPDDFGFLAWNPGEAPQRGRTPMAGRVSLIHRRLSILDLSEAGWQPMSSADGRYHLVFNGEIYNYKELREELTALGHAFHSNSDTEVLLAAYMAWGEACLNRFIGMFAFAVLDVADGTLFLARDFFGIKPLYYAAWAEGWAFGSEIKALLTLPGVDRAANGSKLYRYLRFGLSDQHDETLFAAVRQVPAGHYMRWQVDAPGLPTPVRYWSAATEERIDVPFDQAAACLRELFLDSVRLHLRSDVPVGAALSGGIDSSAIVAAMRAVEPGLDLHAFSFVADDAGLSEERWAEQVSQVTGAKLHKIHLEAADLQHDLERLVAAQDEPFGSTSIYAQYRVFRAAREAGVIVMLDGQGADELLGGYRYFLGARLASLVRQGRWAQAAAFARRAASLPGLGPKGLGMYAADFLLPAGLQEPVRKLAGKDLVPSWMNRDWFEAHGGAIANAWAPTGKEVLRDHLRHTLEHTSLPALLRYEDRNSMAWSLESRVPFLTPALARFIYALPEDYLVGPDGQTKRIFRAAMRGLVPDPILDRKDKIGFAPPERQWMAALTPWVQQVLAEVSPEELPALSLSEVRQEWQAIMEGRRPFDSRAWRWVNLILWARRHQVTFR